MVNAVGWRLVRRSRNFFDQEIDAALNAVRASNPDAAEEQQALGALIASLTR